MKNLDVSAEGRDEERNGRTKGFDGIEEIREPKK